MSRVRRVLACLGLAVAVVLVPSSVAWAGTTHAEPGWSVQITSEPFSNQSYTYSRPVSVPGDRAIVRTLVCGPSSFTGAHAIVVATVLVAPWTAASGVTNFGGCGATAGHVTWSMTLHVTSDVGTSQVLRWQATGAPSSPGTFVYAGSPSPYPTPSPYAVPGPTSYATHYAYPTPQSGGADVDSCASATCTVRLTADSTVGLTGSQYLAVMLVLATLLFLAVAGLVKREAVPILRG